MTLYNLHIYREMRLTFERIEAGSPEEAAAIARDRLTGDADDIDDCDGETFAALVDVVGDEEYRHSVMIDFEPERLRKAASEMLGALTKVRYILADRQDRDEQEDHLLAVIDEAIAKARAESSERRTA